MTLPDPESAMAAKASVPSSSTILPIAGSIGYCYEFTAVASGINKAGFIGLFKIIFVEENFGIYWRWWKDPK